MKRKTILTYVLLFMLIATTAGLGFVSYVEANPFSNPIPFPTPITDKPTIYLASPTNNGTIQEKNQNTIIFAVAMPKSWTWTFTNPQSNISGTRFVGAIRAVTCSLDQTQILNDNTTYGGDPFYSGTKTIMFGQDVGSLSLGQHTVKISVVAYTFYSPSASAMDLHSYDASTNATYTFMVGLSPTPSITPTNSPTPTTSPTELPTSSPSPSPSTSATLEPSLKPIQTPTQEPDNQDADFAAELILGVVVVAAVAVGALVYFKRRKG